MSLDSAIANIGEYYAVHYLAEQFPKDIADRVKAWKEQGSRSVPRRLQALSDGYFRAKAQALEIPDPLQRLTAKAEALAAWHGQLLDALGYAADSAPETHWLELTSERSRLPVRALLHRHQQPWLAICETPFCLSGGEQDEEPLERPVSAPGSEGVSAGDWPILNAPWEKAVARVFAQEDRPRWLMLLAGSRVYLFDAHTYAQRSVGVRSRSPQPTPGRVIGQSVSGNRLTEGPTGWLEGAEGFGQTTLAEREAIKARLESESSAFQRLKRLMDTWCALYFWPLEKADSLPDRAAWLDAAEVLLAEGPASSELDAPWYGVARAIAENQPFHHWELVFTEVLGPGFEGQREPPRGFDLMFGNPPWIKVRWNDAPLLAEFLPLLGVRDAKSATYNRERSKLLEDEGRRRYRKSFEEGEGVGVFLNDRTLYPNLAGVQTNLYKNFIERSWGLLGGQGVAGLLHPEGVFDDPKGGVFREGYYRRLLGHYQLRNERNLFNDVDHHMAFSINIYRGQSGPARMRAMFNLFDTTTIEHSQRHQNPHDPIPGIKSDAGAWETRGHRERILTITEHELGLFARLFEDAGTPPLQARLPQVHSRPLLEVLEKFAAALRRLGDLKGEYFATVMFDETYAQRDGLITREADPTFQPRSADGWVVSGPHFFVGNPLNRTPRTQSLGVKGADYDDIDLTEIPDDYLPRALYRPGDRDGDLGAFLAAIPEWPKPRKPENGSGGFWPVNETDLPAWETLLGEPLRLYGIDPRKPGARTAREFGYFEEWAGDVEGAVRWLLANEGTRNSEAFVNRFSDVRLRQGPPDADAMLRLPRPLTAFHRYAHRRRGHPANERTLMPAILPAGCCHINPVISLAFVRASEQLLVSGHSQSILWDFLVRIGGRGDLYENTLLAFPLASTTGSWVIHRVARLNCLTTHYADLWSSAFDSSIRDDAFTCDLSGASSEDGGFRCAQPTLQEHQHTLPWSELTPEWKRGCALRTDRERRQALLEIDVLVALALNLTPEELIQIYSVQFPVMKAYEEADRYDATGRRLPNTTRKDPGAKELREALTNHDGTTPVTVSWSIDNGSQTRTRTFYPPFVPVDRNDDYRRAWAVFTERLWLADGGAAP